ncbi:hypothetical protein N7475_003899 [Penicillium sp. IBT 31633x]|nr:hypothetical protein N7475_003899 [Penicillium sp. IBT 31633x]
MMNIAPFSKSGLQVIAGEYLAGCVLKWDEDSLFDQLFAAGWELSELLCNMVIVVGPGSPEAFILRVVLAPEFVWFGLHWAGLPYPGKHQLPMIESPIDTNLHLVPLSTYSSHLPDLLQSRPRVASMALHQNMGVGDQWKSLVRRLWVHFEPYGLRSSANSGNDILPTEEGINHIFPPKENVRPMEGVEFVSGVDGDTMICEDSPDMVV